jgi:hypothetical protein
MLIFVFSFIAFMVGLFLALCVARIVFSYLMLAARLTIFVIRGTYRFVRFVDLAPIHVARDIVPLNA